MRSLSFLSVCKRSPRGHKECKKKRPTVARYPGPVLVLLGSGIPGKPFLSRTRLPVSDMGQQQLPQESGELGLTGEGPSPGDRPELVTQSPYLGWKAVTDTPAGALSLLRGLQRGSLEGGVHAPQGPTPGPFCCSHSWTESQVVTGAQLRSRTDLFSPSWALSSGGEPQDPLPRG